MNTRRGFFKQLAGQIGVFKDEFKGVECIPLSRIKELPDKIVRAIEPVFFPDEIWEIRDKVLYTSKDKVIKNIDLSGSRYNPLNYSKRIFRLKKRLRKLH